MVRAVATAVNDSGASSRRRPFLALNLLAVLLGACVVRQTRAQLGEVNNREEVVEGQELEMLLASEEEGSGKHLVSLSLERGGWSWRYC
jgi:hypothetical protein